MKVIIPCGAAKVDYAAPALDMYTGSYFRANRAYALSLVPASDVLILSAKYGLIGAFAWIQPYDVTFGSPLAIDTPAIAAQVKQLGIRDDEVIVLGGKRYRDKLRPMFTRAKFVMDLPLAGMGYQMQWLYRNLGRIPA